ncbi:MAG: pyruvate kinase [Bacteroidales bacterium]|jgi:pyruvate kinase|nr:pyruvate kinase [Bacteroidales bacterium]MDD3700958.1 pyruvate kinase [Bacteroidales bacterium]MDY0370228.1 pyruvate kinase [Bacteroidales bacterium]
MKTKIIATIGPSSLDETILRKMAFAGLDVCRLNFSHGHQNDHRAVIETIHKLNREHNWLISIMADLQGPKIRLGELKEDSITLKAGDRIIFCTEAVSGTCDRVSISYNTFPADVRPGETILVDDGKYQFKVVETNSKNEVVMEALADTTLFPRKGVNLPDSQVSLPSLTTKDILDLEFVLDLGVQWIALSFVRSAIDIHILRSRIDAHEAIHKPKIIAKIEKPQAVNDIDAIIEAADAVMIARGDLGVEIPMETVPMIQKTIIRKCQQAGKPVIVATQMMEGMIDNIRPTRAEVNDVANSVLDGADALMLSAETSIGKYPVETVETMQKIISQIETDEYIYHVRNDYRLSKNDSFLFDAVLFNAIELSKITQAEAIVVVSHSGYSAFRLASYRPKAKLFVFSNNNHLLSSLNMVWGIQGFHDETIDTAEHIMQRINKYLLDHGHLTAGQKIINVLSTPVWKAGSSNTIRLSRAGE